MGLTDRPLNSFGLDYGETHIKVKSDVDAQVDALDELIRHYNLLVDYINRNPLFKSTYEPVEEDPSAPEIVRSLIEASGECDVGPMAAVAGTFSHLIGEYIVSKGAQEVIVENGGDIYLKTKDEMIVGLDSGPSSTTGRIALRVTAGETPCNICTSSGSVGHSISLGEADSVTVFADKGAIADAAATAIANVVCEAGDVEKAIEKARSIGGIRGVLIVKDDTVGAWGRMPEILSGN
ncbi:MAG: UPF0280 family protein [Candidatus Altiarchaeales archaeon]|nr:UPF0280 family protein [Candidatus Altiarchaeales archaeon]MBD3415961.1 UPF0280 family protein [Candidatus Altiarchaeales archaeon]